LTEFDDNVFYPSHPDFNYKRIGQKRVTKQVDVITDEVKNKLANVNSLDELKTIVGELNNSAVGDAPLKFVYSNNSKGYPLTSLVWNGSRANLSVTIKNEGYVTVPDNKLGIDKVDTFQFRNYTLIKDGILNMTKLPVKLNPVTLNKLVGKVTISDADENGIITIDFGNIPVINRSMVSDISAERLGRLEYELIRQQANKKVYDYYDKLLFPRESEGLINKYGKDGEEFLKGLGITDYNGFSPKTELVESTDFYYAVVLDTKISGYSSLPKVSDVEVKLLKDANAVLKPTELLLSSAIKDYLSQIDSDMYKSQDDSTKEKMISNWLKASKDKFNTKRKETMQEIAKIKFSLILSRKWFKEFKNFDDNQLDIDLDGKLVSVKFVMGEETVKI
jgi:hypothetical protein